MIAFRAYIMRPSLILQMLDWQLVSHNLVLLLVLIGKLNFDKSAFQSAAVLSCFGKHLVLAKPLFDVLLLNRDVVFTMVILESRHICFLA